MKPFLQNTFKPGPVFCLAMIFLLGLFLRLYKLDFQSFWMDEYLNILIAKASPDYFADSLKNFIPPLYIYVLGDWLKLVPLSETTARLPNALIGALTVPLFYVLGKEMLGKTAGFWAAFFLAVSTIHIDYSQEAKYYPLMLFFVVIVNLEYWRAVHTKKHAHFFLYGIYFVFMMYTHYYCAVFFVIHWVHAWMNDGKDKRLLRELAITHTLIILSLGPAVIHAAQNIRGIVHSSSWIPAPHWGLPLHSIICMLAGQQWPHHYLAFLGKEALRLLLTGFIIFSIFVFWGKRKETTARKSVFSLILLWIVVPVSCFYFFSLAFFSLYLTRYVLPVMLGIYLFLAWTASNDSAVKTSPIRHWAAWLIIAGYLCMNAWGLRYYFKYPVRIQYRETSQYISQKKAAGDKIALIGHDTEALLINYYLTRFGTNEHARLFRRDVPVPAGFDWIIDGFQSFPTPPDGFSKKKFLGLELYEKRRPFFP